MSEENNKRKSRVDRMEQAVQILKALALGADERMDESDNALNNLTVKIEALADGQAETGRSLRELIEIVREGWGGGAG